MQVIQSGDFYLFDPMFQFPIGPEQYLNHNTITKGAIDFSIREDQCQLLKSGSTDFEHKDFSESRSGSGVFKDALNKC